MKITQAELLDALAAAAPGRTADDARTVAEIREDTGFSREFVLAALHAARRAGVLRIHRVYRETLLGHRQRVPAYTITPVAKPSKKPARRTARK